MKLEKIFASSFQRAPSLQLFIFRTFQGFLELSKSPFTWRAIYRVALQCQHPFLQQHGILQAKKKTLQPAMKALSHPPQRKLRHTCDRFFSSQQKFGSFFMRFFALTLSSNNENWRFYYKNKICNVFFATRIFQNCQATIIITFILS